MDTEKITVAKRYTTSDNEIYCHYSGQNKQQAVYLCLDTEDGTLSAYYDGNIGGSRSFRSFHGLDVEWRIPSLRASALRRLMDKVEADAQIILDNATQPWNESHARLELDDETQDAIDRIERTCERSFYEDMEDIYEIFPAYLWLETTELDELGLSATSTDEEIEKKAQELVADAKGEADLDVDDIESVLRAWRDEACAEEDIDA